MCVVFGQNSIQQKRIIIDVGHGGKDTGAIGINGIQEKDIVLNIANEIIRHNKMILDNRFDIYLTRYRDTLISASAPLEILCHECFQNHFQRNRSLCAQL